MTWVQLNAPMQFTTAGKPVNYQIGDFVEIHNTNELQKLTADGKVRPLYIDDILANMSGGLVAPYAINNLYNLPFTQSEPAPIYPQTIVINQSKGMPKILSNIGRAAIVLKLLKRYELVLIMSSYAERALHIAKDEHERTLAICGDLRIPYYANIFGVTDSKKGKEFCEVLNQEMAYGSQLAMVRALYQTMPITYYLPKEWL